MGTVSMSSDPPSPVIEWDHSPTEDPRRHETLIESIPRGYIQLVYSPGPLDDQAIQRCHGLDEAMQALDLSLNQAREDESKRMRIKIKELTAYADATVEEETNNIIARAE